MSAAYLKKDWSFGGSKLAKGDCTKVGKILKVYLAHVALLEDMWIRLKFLIELVVESYSVALDKLGDDPNDKDVDPNYKDKKFPTLCK